MPTKTSSYSDCNLRNDFLFTSRCPADFFSISLCDIRFYVMILIYTDNFLCLQQSVTEHLAQIVAFQLNVLAVDDGGLTSTPGTLTVNVIRNNFTPEVLNMPASQTIRSDWNPNQPIFTCTSRDNDTEVNQQNTRVLLTALQHIKSCHHHHVVCCQFLWM